MSWIYFSTCLIVFFNPAYSVQVNTSHGTVEGKTETLSTGKQVDAFLGIPYAAPPIGKLRFSPPQPMEQWNETLNATSLPVSCYQAVTEDFKKAAWFATTSPESEDCLYLNIWKPNKPKSKKMAVLIWLHGGVFVSGSSNMPMYDGAVLATENDIIVVSLNYRMGMFGFLYYNSTEVPGNAGLRDQIMAMQWIKDNIQVFGGDPEKITLFGQCSGAISATWHYTNMNIYNLFQNGVIMNLPILSVPTSASLNNSLSLAKSVGCDTANQDEMLACLRAKSPAEILVKDYLNVLQYGQLGFSPVRNGIEVPLDVFNLTSTVPEEKRKSMMGGDVKAELTYFLYTFLAGKPFTLTEEYTASLDDVRAMLKGGFGLRDERLQDVLLHEYQPVDGTYNQSQLRTEAGNIISDFAMICPAIDLLKSWSTSKNKVFHYYFVHRPSQPKFGPVPKWCNPLHGDEVPFWFGIPLKPEKKYSNADKKLSRNMMKYLTNFAKTGNANKGSQVEFNWPSLTPHGNLKTLLFDAPLKTQKFLKEIECAFWSEIFPNLTSIQGQLN